jgi:hypothetical protein
MTSFLESLNPTRSRNRSLRCAVLHAGTTRAALTGLRERGYLVERSRHEKGIALPHRARKSFGAGPTSDDEIPSSPPAELALRCGRELEDQMCSLSNEGYLGDGSPDRLYALVWALCNLMLGSVPAQFLFG